MERDATLERLDPRTARTRAALVAAATDLLDEVDAYAITVQDVVARAGVTRPTFYAHFGDLRTLFCAAGLQRLTESFGRVEVPSSLNGGADTLSETLRPLLVDLRAHAGFFVRVLRGPGGHETQQVVVRFLADRIAHVSPVGPFLGRGDAGVEEAATFLAAGALWLIDDWLATHATRRSSVDAVTERLAALLLSATRADRQETR